MRRVFHDGGVDRHSCPQVPLETYRRWHKVALRAYYGSVPVCQVNEHLLWVVRPELPEGTD